jgi:vitamin B12 transporter
VEIKVAPGKISGYYIRGGVIVKHDNYDGIPVSDASGINIEYDLRLIPVEQVESMRL